MSIAHDDRLEIGHAGRSHRFLLSAVPKHIEQKSRIEARDPLHRNMSGSKVVAPEVQ